MKWHETIASKCRWAEEVEAAFGLNKYWEILWENSCRDYQGHANIFAKQDHWDNNGVYLIYDWTYGSCSGCDSWEGEPRKTIILQILNEALFLEDKEKLRAYFDGVKKQNPPSEYEDNDMQGKIAAMEKELS